MNNILKNNGLTGNQICDRRTAQLIKHFKARNLKVINELDYHIFYETVNLLADTERMF